MGEDQVFKEEITYNFLNCNLKKKIVNCKNIEEKKKMIEIVIGIILEK